MFRTETAFPFVQARFPRWWKVAPDKSHSTNAALLSSGDPFLVEKHMDRGRVLLCTVPLDRSLYCNRMGVGVGGLCAQ